MNKKFKKLKSPVIKKTQQIEAKVKMKQKLILDQNSNTNQRSLKGKKQRNTKKMAK